MVMAVNQERVNVVCDELANAGKGATLAAVRDALGEGSFSTLGPMVRTWKAGRAEVKKDGVAVVVPVAVQAVGGRLLGEVWAMAEQMAAQKLESEQAKTEAARAEMGAELEAAYAGLESLRIELETARGRLEALEQAQAEAQALRVDVAAARAEAAAYKLTIDGFELKKAAKKTQPVKSGSSRMVRASASAAGSMMTPSAAPSITDK
jgi:hypothetical protein